MRSFKTIVRGGMKLGASACLAMTLMGAAGTAWAQDWPTRPVRLVIGLAPGSGSDTIARMMAPKLSAMWKQPVVVENKPGAGTTLAAEHVVTATDRHTFFVGSLSGLLPKYTMKNLRYDPVGDLVPVYRLIDYQLIIATNAATVRAAGGATLRDVVNYSKATPNGVFFAGLGPTSIYSLCLALLNPSLGIRYAGVDYNGVPAMTMAVLRNDAQLLINTPSLMQGQLDSGELRALAVISAERFPNMPDLPTVGEAVGYKGFIPLSWNALFAPKGTSPEIVDRVARDVLTVLSDPEMKKQIESRLTGKVAMSSPAQFDKEYREEALVWKSVFDALNIKPE